MILIRHPIIQMITIGSKSFTSLLATGVEFGDISSYPLPPPAHLYPKSYKNGLAVPEYCPTSRMDSMQTSGFCQADSNSY